MDIHIHGKPDNSSVGATFLVDREAGVAMSRTFAFVLFVNFT